MEAIKCPGSSVWTKDGPIGNALTRLVFKRIQRQVESVLLDTALFHEIREAVRGMVTEKEAEPAIERILGAAFGERRGHMLFYGTVRRLAEHFLALEVTHPERLYRRKGLVDYGYRSGDGVYLIQMRP